MQSKSSNLARLIWDVLGNTHNSTCIARCEEHSYLVGVMLAKKKGGTVIFTGSAGLWKWVAFNNTRTSHTLWQYCWLDRPYLSLPASGPPHSARQKETGNVMCVWSHLVPLPVMPKLSHWVSQCKDLDKNKLFLPPWVTGTGAAASRLLQQPKSPCQKGTAVTWSCWSWEKCWCTQPSSHLVSVPQWWSRDNWNYQYDGVLKA